MDTAPRNGVIIQAKIFLYGDHNLIFWLPDRHTWKFVHDQKHPPCWTNGVYWGLDNGKGYRSCPPTEWIFPYAH